MAVDELVGPAPEGWGYTTLGTACEKGGGDIQTGPFGSQLHAADYVPVGIPSIMPSNIGDNRVVEDGIARITPEDAERLSRYLVRRGDIVYSRRGDVERRALIRDREDGWLCGTGCLRVRFGREGADPSYAAYYLGDPRVREWIVRHAHGATMPNLNTSILSACPFLAPPAAEQRAIAHILGTLDDKIELNRRMNETLEGMARVLFKAWFVDFDPVRAKMDGRWQPGESIPGLPAELYDDFPGRLVESELGEVPEGWEVRRLDSLAELNPTSWSKTRLPTSVRYVDLGNTNWGSIDAIAEYTWADAPSRARRILHPWDTIVGTVRPGNGSFALVMESGLTGSTGFAVLRAKDPVHRSFVYLAATSDHNIHRLAHLAHGAAYPAVRPDVVAATRSTLPPRDLAGFFAERADTMFETSAQALKEAEVLGALRDTLLPKLISGQLRVPVDLLTSEG